VPIVLKSGSLKLLEPSGPAQACNGIAAFPFLLVIIVSSVTNLIFLDHINTGPVCTNRPCLNAIRSSKTVQKIRGAYFFFLAEDLPLGL